MLPAAACSALVPRSLPVLFFLLGAAWTTHIAGALLDQAVPVDLEKKTITVIGYIDDLPVVQGGRVRFDFRIEQARHDGQTLNLPQRARLSFYQSRRGAPWQPGVGSKWRLDVRLKNPHGFQNPGGFDYEAYLLSRHIRATGYVVAKSPKVYLGESGWRFGIDRARERISHRLRVVLGENDQAGIITALANGDRQGLDKSHWGVLMRTGTSHLIAISGLHLSLVSGLVFFLVRFSWGLVEYAAKRLPAQKAAAIAGMFVAGVYAALAGFSIPTQRALIMLVVVYLAVLFLRQPFRLQVLAVALLLVTIIDPMSVLSAGFWLSFAAVVIIYFVTAGNTSSSRWRQTLHIQWAISIGLIPLTILLFQNAALISPVANVVAIPLYGLLVVPLTLIGLSLAMVFPDTGDMVLQVAGYFAQLGWRWLEFVDQFAPLSFSFAAPGIVAAGLAVAGLAIVALPAGVPSRWLGLFWCLPLLLTVERPQAGSFDATLLDVGQGLSLVIRTQNHTLLYDTGAKFSNQFDAGEAVILPFLRSMGVSRVDTVLVSHGDNDHIGGLKSVLKAMPIQRLLTNVGMTADNKKCVKGEQWQWDGVRFEILHPDRGRLDEGNNSSCVLMVSGKHKKLLAPGDIEKQAERQLVARYGRKLDADYLIAPHHGSNTSSSSVFLEAVKPGWILVPAGHLNRYRHPGKRVIARYVQHGLSWLTTGESGAIQLVSSPGSQKPVVYRSVYRRYWHRPLFHPAD